MNRGTEDVMRRCIYVAQFMLSLPVFAIVEVLFVVSVAVLAATMLCAMPFFIVLMFVLIDEPEDCARIAKFMFLDPVGLVFSVQMTIYEDFMFKFRRAYGD